MKRLLIFLFVVIGVSSIKAATIVYFNNTCSWSSTIYCYTWTNGESDQNAPWPGVQMTLIGDNIYSYSSSAQFSNCIFTDNMFQTNDLVAQDGMVFNCNSDQWESYTITPLSGECGDNLSWSFAEGVLTISGTGDMYDYDYWSNAPWYEIRERIFTISLPDNITSIGNYAFRNCTNLTSIIIPNSVISIGDGVFQKCESLNSITIPNTVTSIGYAVFRDCINIKYPVYNSHVFAYMPISYNGAYSIPSGIEIIAGDAFRECIGLTSVTIPNSIIIIGESAFGECSNLVQATIGNSVISIGESAFWSCSKLTNITIPNSVTSIGSSAFESCVSLTSITIPNSVIDLGTAAFNLCDGLTSLEISNNITRIKASTFAHCSNLITVTIPNTVQHIENSAFNGCSSLTAITIGHGVDSIEYCAFLNCNNLKSVTCLAKNPPIMETYAYYNGVFAGVDCSKIPLYVPIGTEPLYATADQWKDFMQIIGIETSVESPVTSTTSSRKQIHDGQIYILRGDKTYTLQGQEVK